jgi:hypothetical protein
MHKPSIASLVYSAMFPRPKTTDPASFSAHITRNLVPEVRIEISTFYGSLDCIEAQYPGLDYSYGPHRMRLGRFPWHRKLFKVFDDLGLTAAEIYSLCRWEGTKSARERYEKEQAVTVRDTTADSIRPATPPSAPSIRFASDDLPQQHVEPPTDSGYLGAEMMSDMTTHTSEQGEEDYSDEEMESYGLELNQRLLYATAARERGADVPLDEDWEQWLKEAVERGNYSDMLNAIRSGQPLNVGSTSIPASLPAQRSVSIEALRNPANNASGTAR